MNDLISKAAVMQILDGALIQFRNVAEVPCVVINDISQKVNKLPEAREATELREQLESASEQLMGDDI